MRKLALVHLFLLMGVLTACATAPKVQTASGRPEVAVKADKKYVIQFFADTLSANGVTIKTVTDYTLVAETPATSAMVKFMLSSRLNSSPIERTTLNFGTLAEETRITARHELVSNPGTAFESVYDVSATATGIQQAFDALKKNLEGGVVGIYFEQNSVVVKSVAPGGPAEKAGLMAGDKVVEVDGKPVTSRATLDQFMPGNPGSDVVLVVDRSGAQSSFKITRDTYANVFGR